MKNYMVSVIVPVYNQQKYIGECLRSLVEQNYDNIEIIVINDGSMDKTQTIIDEWANADKRIITKKIHNSGVSVARNTGINIANGKYIMFVDSDDIIHEDLILSLVKICESGNCDIAYCSIQEFYEENVMGDVHCFFENDNGDVKDFYRILCDKNIDILFGGPYGKLFLLDTIKRNEILFEKNQSIGEDFIFNMEVLKLSPKVACTNSVLYYYRVSSDSLSKKKHRSDLLVDRYKKIFDCFSDAIAANGCFEWYNKARSKLFVRIIRIAVMNVLENDTISLRQKMNELENALQHITNYNYNIEDYNMTIKEKIVVNTFCNRHFALLYIVIGMSNHKTKFLKLIKGIYK